MTIDASIDIFTLPAHPDAAHFPRMPDADLADLAEDIKTNGMSMPILVGLNDDGQPCILDGINRARLAALPASPHRPTASQRQAQTRRR